MMKRLFTILLAIVMIALCALPVSAFQEHEALPDVFYDKSIGSTDQFLVKITRPEGDETTIYKTYLICGNAKEDGITIQLLVENNDGTFEKYVMNDGSGRSSWEVNAYSYFQKEVVLKEGPNRIRVVAYKTNEKYDLQPGKNLQINDFTVTLLNQSIKDYVNKGIKMIGDLLKSFLER